MKIYFTKIINSEKMMKSRTGSILLWIITIAYTCVLAFCLLLMICASIAMQEGLEKAVGLVIAGIGLAGCLLMLGVGGAAIVSAATAFFMRRPGKPEAAAKAEGRQPVETAKASAE